MKWYTLEEKRPEQGKKILYMRGGDFSVRQRFKDMYLAIPFTDSVFSEDSAPEKWAEIDFPDGFEGYLTIDVEGNLVKLDELEKLHPDAYELFIECVVSAAKESKNAMNKEQEESDLINSPSHYQGREGLEAIDVIRNFDLGFVLGNAVKYILRCDKKGNRLEDLRKAEWYLKLAITSEEIENLDKC